VVFTKTVVVALAIFPLISTVKISPLTAPLATGFCNVGSLNDARPLLLHNHEIAPEPVSYKFTSAPAHIGPELLAVAVCPHPFAETNKKRPAKRKNLTSLRSLKLLILKRETTLIIKCNILNFQASV
jgi:hypothetical protein